MPAERIADAPMPSNRASESYWRILSASATALASPDASPEERKYRIVAHSLFQDAALRRGFEKRDDVASGLRVGLILHPRNRLRYVVLRVVQQLVEAFDLLAIFDRKTGSAQTDAIEPVWLTRIAFDQEIRRYVFGEFAHAAHHCVLADASELMDAGLAADRYVIF